MTSLELTLSKIPDQWKPPRRRSLALAAKQNTLYNFGFARATQKPLKGKEYFAWLCSGRAGGGIFARTARHSSPQTPSCRAVLAWCLMRNVLKLNKSARLAEFIIKNIVMTNNLKIMEWVLRIAVAGEFIGHGVFAMQGKQGWFKYFHTFGITDSGTITTLLFLVGVVDVALAILILIKPVRIALLWMVVWGLWTAMIRWPFGPDPIWDFVERWANWGAPLALLLLVGWPKNWKKWFK